ncbi:DUF3368 domain-containing protein [Segetibacter sp.]|uniref:DUF3368 domain-containing protein n=1 Tax=Segetibacter sp. TaxID=2231182 RepID=UPI00262C98E9|nr:DUF3368 domain-containing protein [Segetibacter sp.]
MLIIDDRKGRKFAYELGLTIIGTVGIIVDAKLTGIIPSVGPIPAKMRTTNFRFTERPELLILQKLVSSACVKKGVLL